MMQASRGNEGSKAITIYDIAREAGVSAATVSRVLTKSANVRPEKKEKVQALIVSGRMRLRKDWRIRRAR